MQALHWGCSENCFNETATQLQALEIILISFLVWLIYSKTISGLTKILMMLEQHLHRGLQKWKGQFSEAAFMLPQSKSAAGQARQGNRRRLRVLAAAALLSKLAVL